MAVEAFYERISDSRERAQSIAGLVFFNQNLIILLLSMLKLVMLSSGRFLHRLVNQVTSQHVLVGAVGVARDVPSIGVGSQRSHSLGVEKDVLIESSIPSL